MMQEHRSWCPRAFNRGVNGDSQKLQKDPERKDAQSRFSPEAHRWLKRWRHRMRKITIYQVLGSKILTKQLFMRRRSRSHFRLSQPKIWLMMKLRSNLKKKASWSTLFDDQAMKFVANTSWLLLNEKFGSPLKKNQQQIRPASSLTGMTQSFPQLSWTQE